MHYRIRDVLDRQQYHALALPFELDLLDLQETIIDRIVDVKLDIAGPAQGEDPLVEAALHRQNLAECIAALNELLFALLRCHLPRVHSLLVVIHVWQKYVAADFFENFAGKKPIKLLCALILVNLLNISFLGAAAFGDAGLII